MVTVILLIEDFLSFSIMSWNSKADLWSELCPFEKVYDIWYVHDQESDYLGVCLLVLKVCVLF